MKLVIFSEAGFAYGFGHFYRMSGICDKAAALGGDAAMCLLADEAARDNLARDYVKFVDWKDPKEYSRILHQDVMLVVDSYHVDMPLLQEFRKLAGDMIVIDDNIRLDYRDMKILNPNFFSVFMEYPPGKGNRYYLGKDYTLLRDEFPAVKERPVREKVTDIMITMGGTDPKGLTAAMVDRLHGIDPEVHLHVVITRAYQDQDVIRGKLREGDRLYSNIGAAEMAGLMRDCDFAVAAAGGTTNELIRMQCPAVLVPVADNQLNNVRYLSEHGFVEVVEAGGEEVVRGMFSEEKRRRLCAKLATFYSESSGKDFICGIAFNGGNDE